MALYVEAQHVHSVEDWTQEGTSSDENKCIQKLKQLSEQYPLEEERYLEAQSEVTENRFQKEALRKKGKQLKAEKKSHAERLRDVGIELKQVRRLYETMLWEKWTREEEMEMDFQHKGKLSEDEAVDEYDLGDENEDDVRTSFSCDLTSVTYTSYSQFGFVLIHVAGTWQIFARKSGGCFALAHELVGV